MKITQLQALTILAKKYNHAESQDKFEIIKSYMQAANTTTQAPTVLANLLKDDALSLYEISNDGEKGLFKFAEMQQIIDAVAAHTQSNTSNGEVVISVGEGLLMTINACKKAHLPQEIINQLQALYLEGIKSDLENEFVTDIKALLADQKQLKVSSDPKVINNDPTRRYFETHLSYHLLGSKAETLDTEQLRVFTKNIQHNLWSALAGKSETKTKVNHILNGRMDPSLNKYELEYAELIMKLKSHNYHGLSPKACDNLIEIAKATIIATLNTQHDKSMPADIYADSIFTMGMDGRGRTIKKNHQHVLTGFKGLMMSTSPVPPGDIARNGDTEEYEELLYQDDIDEHGQFTFDKNKKINRIPVIKTTKDDMGQEKQTPVTIVKEKLIASTFERSADQATYMLESQWNQHVFARQTHVYSNGISSTTLATLRNILMQKREGNPSHNDYFEDYMVSFAALMVYNSGGHSLFEIMEVFKLPQFKEIMEKSGCSELIEKDKLMQQWLLKDNQESFNKALDETLTYMDQLVNRRIVNAQLINWAANDRQLKSIDTSEPHDMREQLAIESPIAEKSNGISLHNAILTLSGPEFKKRLNESKKLNLNAKNGSGYTALMVAAQIGKLEHVKALVAKGANVSIRQDQKMNALELAIKSEQYAVVSYLLSVPQTQTKPKDLFFERFDTRELKEKSSPLYYACRQKDMRILRKVIQSDKNISLKDLSHALQETIKFENIAGALTIINQLTPKQLSNYSNTERQHILNLAAEKGNLSLLASLLESKISLPQEDIDYNAMVSAASKRGYLPIVRLLLNEAFQMDAPLQKNTLNKMMTSALSNNQYDLVVLFILYGADIDIISITNQDLAGFTQYLRSARPEHYDVFFSNSEREMISLRTSSLQDQYKDRTTGVWRSFIDLLVLFLDQLPLVNLGGYYHKTEVMARLGYQVITNEVPKKDYEIGYGEPPASEDQNFVSNEQKARPSVSGIFNTTAKSAHNEAQPGIKSDAETSNEQSPKLP